MNTFKVLAHFHWKFSAHPNIKIPTYRFVPIKTCKILAHIPLEISGIHTNVNIPTYKFTMIKTFQGLRIIIFKVLRDEQKAIVGNHVRACSAT